MVGTVRWVGTCACTVVSLGDSWTLFFLPSQAWSLCLCIMIIESIRALSTRKLITREWLFNAQYVSHSTAAINIDIAARYVLSKYGIYFSELSRLFFRSSLALSAQLVEIYSYFLHFSAFPQRSRTLVQEE
ncbi:hypothetical protein F9C07_1733480 [Aspergillus flavus]|uniref:Uncharacterized protein n=1 Tax=Aspergillus flavus (strain ATCC 200026 / FGSC A1120 / IAM 13836 / NRRL 3357 / JCM 12722 / SRRC 167) TaxID=332952 RepID=A0A7U2R2E7_ASPFN|nr:hypothetical protein F9C07_1733480 [Aspergillus flavus]